MPATGALFILAGAVITPAHAVCTQSGSTVVCAGVANPLAPSFSDSGNNLNVTVDPGASVGVLLGVGGTSLSLTGNGVTVTNNGTIDPAALGTGLGILSSGLIVGNASASTTTVTNNDVLNGSTGASVSGVTGMALGAQNGTGGVTNITNTGTISSDALSGATYTGADALVVMAYGGAQVNFNNSGTIEGRVSFQASGTPGAGNTFVNSGTINGSVSLGANSTNTFTALTGSSVNTAGGTAGVLNVDVGALTLEFAATGTVDGGADGNNTLVLQQGSGGPATGSIDNASYINFQHLDIDSGTWTVSGAANYEDATLSGGVAVIDNASALGTGTITSNGGALQATVAGFNVGNLITVGLDGLTVEGSNDITLSGVISGTGGLNQSGTETLTLANANTFTGGVTLSAGGLIIGNNSALGTGALTVGGNATLDSTSVITLPNNIILNAGLTIEGSNEVTLNGEILGTGTLVKDGAATLTLNGTNDYSGGTTITAGTLQGNTSSLQGNIVDNAALVFDQTVSGTYNGVISGTGTLTQSGTGTLILNGANTYNGLTTVASGGTLIVGDSSHTSATVGGDVSVNGGTLGGYGTVLGSVTLSNGAALTPGEAGAIGSLTIDGDLTIGDGSQLNFDFGAPGTNFSTPGQSDHVVVGGDLSIGSSTLNVNNLGSMGPGLYELFSWADTLSITGGGFTPPSGMTVQIFAYDKEIALIDDQGVTLDEWDANGLASPSQMGGGSGTWSTSSDTWSNTNGQYLGPMTPQPGFAIFGGAAGTVTVDDSGGEVSVTGMQFVSDGYLLTGDAIDLVEQNGVAPVLRVSSGDTATIDNVLQGTDGFNKTDGGTLVLTGTNTYTGTTTLSGGYLSVSSDANLGASADPLDFEGGTLEITGTTFNQTARSIIWGSSGGGFDIDDASNTFTVTQALTGTGGLLKSGAGTLVLSGANTYSGGTVIDAGTLQGNTTSLQGNITNDATLVFAQTSNGTFSGSMSGSGQLIKNGGGTLILSGTNTYTGGTTINAGTLQGNSNSLQGNIVNNAALVFDQTGSGTYSGVISGSGTLTMNGTGMLTLTGANTYTGGTTVNAGTLQGDTTTLQGNITDNAALVFNQGSDGTFSSVISGSGSLTKAGAGTLILDGTNTYTGGTTITAGTLEVGDSNTASASIDGTVDVQGDGVLRGHGTINGNVVSDGIVWPGGTMGTLTINGNYTQNADGTLQLDVTPSQSSMLQVSGNATVAGTLVLIFAPGTYSSSKFNLLQAGSVSGTFNTVDGTVPEPYTSQISYTATDIDLVLARRLVQPLDGALFGNLMRSVNVTSQQDLGSVLDVALTPGGTQCNADHATSMQNITASCGTGTWAQYTGSSISLNGADGSHSTTFGLLGGADYALGDAVHAGVEAGVGQVNGSDTNGGNGRVDNVHGGLYAYADAGPTVLSAVIDAMHSDYHFNRASGIGTASSAPDGNMQSAAVQAAYPLQLSQWQLTPKVGVTYQRQTLDGFTETLNSTTPNASSFPVDGARSRYTTLQPYADMVIAHSFVADGVVYVPQLSLGYRYDTRNSATPIVQVTAQDGTVFDLPGTTQGRGMGTASARITAEAGASWSLYADYQGFFGNRLHDNALSVGFTKHF
ncbi:beta strand repeat-containing protein [Dyella flava]|uniref:Autotransporter-associated beta strand repeat-containing protein n=1 Tax=Dyella flava TaxID=1920170 RepID=A0ABS2K6B0_9GAMM|nr:autotransporter-associated beta strand repeat-containing protein [Dyella flava]MBM7126699.1 autotransporter-associated beta strand repeat-containing protein [Dyella flava]GLQ49479.1 hypothetical protein GCM10010872_09280 [Dyella flava]